MFLVEMYIIIKRNVHSSTETHTFYVHCFVPEMKCDQIDQNNTLDADLIKKIIDVFFATIL